MSDKRGAIPMDALIAVAARALAAGDPLGALQHIALRGDAHALALRGIAMAQLGELAHAKRLLREAARAFGPKYPLARARCSVAEAEVALAARDLARPTKGLDAARALLEAHGDRLNAAHARHVAIRRALLLGRIGEAERELAAFDVAPFPPAWLAAHELLLAGVALRRLQIGRARESFEAARRSASRARIPALRAEVETAAAELELPAARLIEGGAQRTLRLREVEQALASGRVIVDACQRCVRDPQRVLVLARRPVLFALVRALGEAWPADVPRSVLLARAFGARRPDDSHRARLRVEIARLRALLRPFAGLNATARGFELRPHGGRELAVLAPLEDEQPSAVHALLGDGESWSSSALALALGTSQRSVQRALDGLAAELKVQAIGRGRARRWLRPLAPGFATSLSLPVPQPAD